MLFARDLWIKANTSISLIFNNATLCRVMPTNASHKKRLWNEFAVFLFSHLLISSAIHFSIYFQSQNLSLYTSNNKYIKQGQFMI